MQEINLYDLMRYYAKNWFNLLGALLLGAIIGLSYTHIIQTPLYKSEATMIVTGNNKVASAESNLNANYAELFKSRLVLETVVREQNYTGSYEQLLYRTTAITDKGSDILRVTMADPNPETSRELLKASVDTFKSQTAKIYPNTDNIKTVDTASLPSSAYNVKSTMQLGLAMAATFFAAVIALFFVYDYKNSDPKRTRATEKSGKQIKLPLGGLGKDKGSRKGDKVSKNQDTNNTQVSVLTPEVDAKKSTEVARTKNVNTATKKRSNKNNAQTSSAAKNKAKSKGDSSSKTATKKTNSSRK